MSDEQIHWVENTLNAMDDTDKIGQIFCAEIRAGDTECLETVVERYRMGAVMCLPSAAEKNHAMIAEIQKKAKIPLLIAGNLEEGADAVGGHNIANNLELGATGDDSLAGKMGEITAREGMAVGMNWAFAPVVDIGMNWRNPVIATRVFGEKSKQVAAFGEAFIRQMQPYGMAATMKHFPGDGVDERDQHFSPSVNSLSCEEWNQSFGMVYRRCIDAGVLTAMVGHMLQPALARAINPALKDEDMLPASTSKELVTGLLREHLGFNGMISTDSTTMTAFDQLLPRWKALPAAIMAGCDMILFTENMDEDIRYMRTALHDGLLTIERLDEAVLRVLAVKAALGLPEKRENKTLQLPLDESLSLLGRKEGQELSAACARASVTLVKDRDKLLPLSPDMHKRVCLFAYAEGRGFGSSAEQVAETMKNKLEQEGFSVTMRKAGEPFAEWESVKESFDWILYVSNQTSISNKTVCRMDWGPSMGRDAPNYLSEIPTVFVSFGNPYHLVDVPRVKTFINAYKFKEDTVDAVIRKLLGRESFEGVSPVDPFCGFWDTKL